MAASCAGSLRRGGRRRGGLDDGPHLDELVDEVLGRHRRATPGEDVGIEVIPEARIAHAHAGLLARFDEPLRRQYLQRLAQHGAADGKLLRQTRFAGQRIAGTQDAADDQPAELFDDLDVQVPWACRLRGHEALRSRVVCILAQADPGR